MTWLKGNSTWGALSSDITRLMCGEIADGSSTTCASGDRWLREVTRTVTDGVLNSTTTLTSATAAFTSADVGASVYATGVPVPATIASVTNGTTVVLSVAATTSASGVTVQICSETIRTPAAKDVPTGAMSNRTGYFAAVLGGTMTTPATTSCRVSNPFTADPSTSGFHRWYVAVAITTVNSVGGNYSTAKLSYQYFDSDNNTALGSAANVAVSAAGVAILGSGLQVTLSDPSGVLQLNVSFYRAFTPTYMYGIDWWPMLHRQGNTAPAFSVAPPGSAGTDYDIVAVIPPANGVASTLGSQDRGTLYHGLGIKTGTGLGTGALYTVSHPMALIKCRIFNSATAGVLSLDVGSSKRDAGGSVVGAYRTANLRVTSWVKMFQTPASVTAASAVQYWLSVTNDGVFVILNADPANTGKLGTAFIGAYTPTEATYDVFPVVYNVGVVDYTADTGGQNFTMATQYGYWMQRRHLDGSEAPRDWQTGWMRGEHYYGFNLYTGMQSTDLASYNNVPVIHTNAAGYALTALGVSTSSTAVQVAIPARQNKPSPDGKWWLYGVQFGEGTGWTPASSSSTDENRNVRGTLTRYLYLPDSGWTNGDDLTDTVTGAKYFLVTPDYVGAGGRLQISAGTFQGGVAVLEV